MKNKQKNIILKLTRLKLILLFTALTFNISPAQSSGSIGGKITDASTNEELIGANVIVIGTLNGTSTDIDGNYIIPNLKPGKYSLKYSYISFQSAIVEDIEVKSGSQKKINIKLKPESTEIGEVVVTAEALKNTEGNLLNIQKNSFNIVDGMSAELIGKNNSSDGTDILKRMTGVTISEGKYAYVRGVGDRYNSTMLNGSSLPSTDPEKRSFSYDMFPASLIENIITSKTFTPDKPADFAGGLVEINTVEFPDKFIFDLSLSSSYNSLSNLTDFVSYYGGKKDWLGFDDGTRKLPSIITKEKISRSNFSQPELQEIGLAFKNDWQTKRTKTPLNSGLKINVGNNYSLGEYLFGYIASFTYSNSDDIKQIEKNNFTFEGPRYLYKGNSYTNSVAWGGLLNLSYKLGKSHKFSVKNTYNQNADDETTIYEGAYFYNPDYRNITSLRYISRSLVSTQVLGEHHFDLLGNTNLSWVVNYANSKRDEPDARRYVYVRDLDTPEQPMRFLLDQSISTRFFGDLNDNSYGGSFNVNMQPFEDPSMPSFKFGVHYDKKDRDFSARIFGFKNIPGGNFKSEDSLMTQDVQDIFSEENFAPKFIEITEITKSSDSYKSNQEIQAAYLMTDFQVLSKLKVIVGVRFEKSSQELTSHTITDEVVKINPTYNDWLPSINLTYLLTDKINIRAAYTKTLARPEFRELAPFSYFDFLSYELVQGNINLKRSLITNSDLRFEWYPAAGELFAVSGFYKEFKDPIEQILIASSGFEPIRSYENAAKATTYGVEFELRKNFNFISKTFENFSFVGNLSLISSEIKLKNANGFQAEKRPLQGQADFITNLGIYYEDYFNGFSASLIYNKVGERISKVGFANLGDIIEKPRDQFDLSVSKKLFDMLKISLAAKDILAQNQVFIQRTLDGDKVAEKFKKGSTFSLGISYQL